MTLTLRYFAAFGDLAGRAHETMDWDGGGLGQLYDALRARYAFPLPRERVRVAIDGRFVDWDHALHDGADVVFVPPVSGG